MHTALTFFFVMTIGLVDSSSFSAHDAIEFQACLLSVESERGRKVLTYLSTYEITDGPLDTHHLVVQHTLGIVTSWVIEERSATQAPVVERSAEPKWRYHPRIEEDWRSIEVSLSLDDPARETATGRITALSRTNARGSCKCERPYN